MTLIQEKPRNSDNDATHTTNSNTLAPSSFITSCNQPPASCPTIPPAVSLNPAGEKCSVESAQLDISVAMNPPKRSPKSSPVSSICVFCSRYSIQPRKKTITAKRYAGRPKVENNRSATQAPTRPIPLLMLATSELENGPGSLRS